MHLRNICVRLASPKLRKDSSDCRVNVDALRIMDAHVLLQREGVPCVPLCSACCSAWSAGLPHAAVRSRIVAFLARAFEALRYTQLRLSRLCSFVGRFSNLESLQAQPSCCRSFLFHFFTRFGTCALFASLSRSRAHSHI